MLAGHCTIRSGDSHNVFFRLSTGADLIQVEPFIQICLARLPESLAYLDVSTILKLVDTTMALALKHLRNKENVTLSASIHFSEGLPVHHSAGSTPSATQEGGDAVRSGSLVQLLNYISSLLQVPQSKMEEPTQGVSANIPETLPGAASEQASSHSQDNASGEAFTDKKHSGTLASMVLQRSGCLSNMLECLKLCSTNNTRVLPPGPNPDDVSAPKKPVSIEDSVLQLLCTLQSQTSEPVVLIDGVMNYLRSGLSAGDSPKGLSEPLLQFLFRVLKSKEEVAGFYSLGKSWKMVPQSAQDVYLFIYFLFPLISVRCCMRFLHQETCGPKSF